MSAFGSIGTFDRKLEPFAQYNERLHQYFIANEIEVPERQRAIFLTTIGPETYGLLKDLISPNVPAEQPLTELIATLAAHFEPTPSVIVERYRFNCRSRKSSESVADFIAELRKLAKQCAYGTSLDEMLRDRFVCGINDEAIQRKLLAEPRLTLTSACEIALAMEAAARNTSDLRSGLPYATPEVNRMQCPRQKKIGATVVGAHFKGTGVSGRCCLRCGDTTHHSNVCRFAQVTCHSCGKVGHLSKVCLSKGKVTQPKFSKNKRGPARVNKLQTVSSNVHSTEKSLSEVSAGHTMLHMDSMGQAPPPARVCCCIEGQDIFMEVDSGAPFSLIPVTVFNRYKSVFPALEETSIRLQSYTKHSIEILGQILVRVVYQKKELVLPLLVVQQGSICLAGRNWIAPLGLASVLLHPSDSIHQVRVTPATLEEVRSMHKELFSPGLGHIKGVKVHLSKRDDVSPKFYKARPVPYALREKVDREIDRLVLAGIIEPIKSAEWAAPVVPVLKRDGTVRLCGDFKITVNLATHLEQYPLPKIEDLFAQISGGESFTKLDLQDAYCQLELDDESKDLVVINTHRGLFRYKRLAFGIASAPAIFQRELEKILQGQVGASCYLDDLLVTGSTKAQHLHHLDQVLTRLEEAGVKLHATKCQFMQSSVEYLGHRIDKDGLHPVSSKLEAIEKAPAPKNVEELRSFLGLITYYAKFLPNMATLLAPLYKLLQHSCPWSWTNVEEKTFRDAKKALMNSSLLVHFDDKKPVILACDASPYGLGAVLSHETEQGERPIAFASRSLSKAERNYSQIERETLALVFGVTRFRNYLLGRHFRLVTDHQPLLSLLSESKPVPAVAAARIQRWALTLSAYSYEIRYRKGSQHCNADACSRLPVVSAQPEPPVPPDLVLLMEQQDDTPLTAHRIATEVDSVPALREIRKFIHRGWPKSVREELRPFWQCRHELSVHNGVILRGTRVYIPSRFRGFILDELHSAHQGISSAKAIARSSVWWPNIDKDIEVKIRSCSSCQENSSMPPAKPVAWPNAKKPWNRIHIDHAGPVEGHILLIVVDAATKWLEVLPVSSTSSAVTISALRSLFARYGLPESLVSDNATSFTSEEFSVFMQNNGIHHIRTAPFHPNSNGLAERAVRTVKTALRKATFGSFKERLERFLLNYRNTPLAASGLSPAMAMLGRTLRTRLDLLRTEDHLPAPSSPCHVSSFRPGDNVWARNFGKGQRWIPATVLSPQGRVMLRLQTPAGHLFRHVDQVRRGVDVPCTSNNATANLPEAEPSLPAEASTSSPDTSEAANIQGSEITIPSSPDSHATSEHPTDGSPGFSPPQRPVSSTPNLRRSTRCRRPPRRLGVDM